MLLPPLPVLLEQLVPLLLQLLLLNLILLSWLPPLSVVLFVGLLFMLSFKIKHVGFEVLLLELLTTVLFVLLLLLLLRLSATLVLLLLVERSMEPLLIPLRMELREVTPPPNNDRFVVALLLQLLLPNKLSLPLLLMVASSSKSAGRVHTSPLLLLVRDGKEMVPDRLL